MRLLHVVPTYLPATRYGGPIHSVHGLCKALVLQGHEVHVFTSSLDGAERSPVPEGVPVDLDGVKVWYFRCRWMAICWLPGMVAPLKQLITGFDCIHLHSVFLWPMAEVARMARKHRIPYVLSPRGMLVPELIAGRSAWAKRIWITLIEVRNLRGAVAIHVTSLTEATDLQRSGLDLAPLAEISNGVDLRDSLVRKPLDKSLLFLGRLSWKKNLSALIEAVATLSGSRLTLAGPDDEGIAPDLLNRALMLGCGERVRWIGAVGDAEKSRLFGENSCLVLPSINENFGNVVIEAMAHACPVVVSPGVGARTVVDASWAGMVASAATGAALADAIARLLADPEHAAECGRRGRNYVREHLTWAGIANRMTDLYRAHAR